jgi:hypothetical protein
MLGKLYKLFNLNIEYRYWNQYVISLTQQSEIALSRKSFGRGHMYIYTFLLRITDTMTSKIIDFPSWETLHIGLLALLS